MIASRKGGASRSVAGTGGILLENALTLVLALGLGWSTRSLMWIYWWQSVVIGVFSYRRMMALREFSTDGFTSGGKPVPETEAGKRSTARFFALHFGGFHAGYLAFLLVSGAPATIGLPALSLAVASFVWAHWNSFRRNLAEDLAGRPNIGTLMFLPYARILPMHLLIVFGGLLFDSRLAVVAFIGLKTGADVAMHLLEHHVLRRGSAETAGGRGGAEPGTGGAAGRPAPREDPRGSARRRP